MSLLVKLFVMQRKYVSVCRLETKRRLKNFGFHEDTRGTVNKTDSKSKPTAVSGN